MPLVEHLFELRDRLVKSALAIVVGVVAAFFFRDQVFEFLKHPYCQTTIADKLGCNLVSLDPLEQFNVTLRISFIAGTIGASPVWLYQFGAFITPALYKKERRYAAGFLISSLVLFLLGAAFAYLTLQHALDFLLSFTHGVTPLTTMSKYLSFVTLLLLAFGIAFEFPVVLMFLNVVGIFPSSVMRKWRRGMIVFIAIASAVITPTTDPYTFCLMAIPLYLLYELVILLARVREKRVRAKTGDGDVSYAELDDDETSPLHHTPTPVEEATPVGEVAGDETRTPALRQP